MVLIIRHLIHQVSEFFIIFEIGNFKSTHIFFLFSLFYAHKADILLQTHQFSFDTLENLVEEHRGGVALAINHLIVWFLHLKTAFEHCNSLFKCGIQALQLSLLFFTLLSDTN